LISDDVYSGTKGHNRHIRLVFAYNWFMPPRKLTLTKVFDRLLNRLEKRMEALQRLKLGRYGMSFQSWKLDRTRFVALGGYG
jgi:hypothetical protein